MHKSGTITGTIVPYAREQYDNRYNSMRKNSTITSTTVHTRVGVSEGKRVCTRAGSRVGTKVVVKSKCKELGWESVNGQEEKGARQQPPEVHLNQS